MSRGGLYARRRGVLLDGLDRNRLLTLDGGYYIVHCLSPEGGTGT